ncbi:MAG: permease, partial [Verrucomicrobiota bacterium]
PRMREVSRVRFRGRIATIDFLGACSCTKALSVRFLPVSEETHSCCCGGEEEKRSIDWLLWWASGIVAVGCLLSYLPHAPGAKWAEFVHSIRELFGKMWWGIALGMVAVGILQFVPQRAISRLLGKKANFLGLLRAVGAGVVLDVCSHGVLLVSMQLYRRGLSLGQTMAFLIASPWNSFSLTLILIALIGWKWTFTFLAISLLVALIAGMAFSWLERTGKVPTNPHQLNLEEAAEEAGFREQARTALQKDGWIGILKSTFNESRMILRWIFFGIVLASVLRILFDPSTFADWFGPTVAGLFLTLLAATIIEVCSEGSSPIAADLLTRASAPGNSFTFLMAGVATDYTEIMSVKETTRSWKIALLIPALTIPQVLLIGWLLNRFASTG